MRSLSSPGQQTRRSSRRTTGYTRILSQVSNSDYRNHPALARKLQAYLRWRNAQGRYPDMLAAQRRERARIRSERQQRWGRPKPKAA